MPWAGGSFTRLNGDTGWVDDASLGIGIEAGEHDLVDTDFKNGINQCLTKDGQNAATADLPMGAFKHTNVANATARNNYAAVGQVQDGDFIWLGTAGGTATALTANASPAITTYKAGQKFRLITASGSTGATVTAHTLQINGIAGPKNIVEADNSNPTLGTWGTGVLLELTYNGTAFVITNNPGVWLSYTPTVTPIAGTATGVTISTALFRKTNRSIQMHVCLDYTQSGASTSWIAITTPTNILSTAINVTMSATIVANANTVCAFTFNDNSTRFRLYAYDQQQILTGVKTVLLSGVYPCG